MNPMCITWLEMIVVLTLASLLWPVLDAILAAGPVVTVRETWVSKLESVWQGREGIIQKTASQRPPRPFHLSGGRCSFITGVLISPGA